MRYVIIAILIYLAYFILRSVLRNLVNRSSVKPAQKEERPRRSYNLAEVQDAEFREIKKTE